MKEQRLKDVGKVLAIMATKIEEVIPKCHKQCQTDRHKKIYRCDAVIEFSEWTLLLMITSRHNDIRLTIFTALHESIRAKAEVQLVKDKSGRIGYHVSYPTHILIGYYYRYLFVLAGICST